MSMNRRPHPVKPPMEGYHSRTLAYLCVALTFTALGIQRGFDLQHLIVIGYCLTFPHLVRLTLTRFNAANQRQGGLVALALDAFQTGVLITLSLYNLIPSLMFLLLISFASSVIGGPLYLVIAWLLALLGLLASSLVLMPTPQIESSLVVMLTCLISASVFIVIVASYVYQQGRSLEKARRAISAEQERTARLASNLSRYLSPQVWESIFSGERSVTLETRRKKMTVFFSDIRGFTELAEEMEAEALTDLLNHYLNEMAKIALEHGGTIDKFIGDCVMIFFGDPVSKGAKEDAEAAVAMAIAMRKHMKVLRQQWRTRGITRPLEIRMGLSTGYCTVGNFGANTRMDYTIIGREVNLASRLESAADSGEILISHQTWSLVKDRVMCRDKGEISVKGFSRPVQVYQVIGLRSELGAAPSYLEEERPGFSMYMDTNNIRNYDKDEIVKALEQAARKLRDKIII